MAYLDYALIACLRLMLCRRRRFPPSEASSQTFPCLDPADFDDGFHGKKGTENDKRKTDGVDGIGGIEPVRRQS